MGLLKSIAALLAVTMIVATLWLILSRQSSPLAPAQPPTCLSMNLSMYGAYPEAVNRIRLSELTNGKVVWELSSGDTVARLHDLTLRVGDNPASIDADYGRFVVIAPADSGSFSLRGGIEYNLEVWNATGSFTRNSFSCWDDNNNSR